jgi:CRP/FNR family cyclic AMP-dependent transcriptional regulator
MLQKRACDLLAPELAEIIRQSGFGPYLDDELLLRLAANSIATDYRRRRFIYRAGDPADALYLIARGRVKLCRVEAATAREAVIDILSAGSLFGESALYTAGSREKCAVAYENSRLLRIPVGDFKEGMVENRELYDYTFQLIGQRLARAERMVADFALDAIPARLEKLLLEFSRRYGINESNGVLIDIPLPHREIASIVGSTRESVTVRLNAMRRDGIIDFVNRKILIKRPESLAAA